MRTTVLSLQPEKSRRAYYESITTFVETKLKLKVNREKSAVDRPWRRKFLGFTFTHHRDAKIRISKQSIQRLKQRIRELTSRRKSISMKDRLEKLNRYLVGWLGYYQLAEDSLRSLVRLTVGYEED